jgi:hypothetical protein
MTYIKFFIFCLISNYIIPFVTFMCFLSLPFFPAPPYPVISGGEDRPSKDLGLNIAQINVDTHLCPESTRNASISWLTKIGGAVINQ